MEQVRKLTQAYPQVPWRKQQEIIGTFLLVVVALALVGYIYLNVSERTDTKGRQIQDMQVRLQGVQRVDFDYEKEALPIEELKIEIADLEAQLAVLTSREVMSARAEAMGFDPYEPDDALYLEVPGYVIKESSALAPSPVAQQADVILLQPAYTQSLIDVVKAKWVDFSTVIQLEKKR